MSHLDLPRIANCELQTSFVDFISKASLPREARLRLGHQYKAVRENGTSAYGPFFRLACLKKEAEATQLGVIVSKRVGPAVTRNNIKRRFREIYRNARPCLLPDFWLVIIAAPKAATASFQELEKEWLRLGTKLSIFIS
jgi:ribonuclease P protein component